MSGLDFEKLIELRKRKHALIRAERKHTELLKQIRAQEALITKLEVELEMEQQDIEKLTRMSLTNLFHTILRSKQEQLELERQEALAAAFRLQEAKKTLAELQQDLIAVNEQITELANAHTDYEQAMAQKEAALRNSPKSAHELEEMETQITEQSLLVKEIGEALSAGKGVMGLLTDASNSLQRAENWGNWDMWAGGGVVSTYIKHSYVDEASNFIHHANRQLEQFQKELADLKHSANIHIDISGTLKMADYWFDGLITDWLVQGKIVNAQEKTLEALHQVRMVVRKLEADYDEAERQLQQLKNKRLNYIENTV